MSRQPPKGVGTTLPNQRTDDSSMQNLPSQRHDPEASAEVWEGISNKLTEVKGKLNQTEPTLEEAVQKLEASSGKGVVEPNAVETPRSHVQAEEILAVLPKKSAIQVERRSQRTHKKASSKISTTHPKQSTPPSITQRSRASSWKEPT